MRAPVVLLAVPAILAAPHLSLVHAVARSRDYIQVFDAPECLSASIYNGAQPLPLGSAERNIPDSHHSLVFINLLLQRPLSAS